MTILTALKKLHKKMTGQDTTSKTIGGVLDSMQENYSGSTSGDGGSSLPEMAGQSGKFLTNDGTEASWSDVPSGGTDYTVVLTVVNPGEPDPEYAATLDGEAVTLAELLTLAAANAPLRVVAQIDSNYISAPVTNWHSTAIAFTAPIIVGADSTPTAATALVACNTDGTSEEWVVATL